MSEPPPLTRLSRRRFVITGAAAAAGYRSISEEPLEARHDLRQAIADRVVPGLAAFFGARAC